jgi:hypothetical protein
MISVTQMKTRELFTALRADALAALKDVLLKAGHINLESDAGRALLAEAFEEELNKIWKFNL